MIPQRIDPLATAEQICALAIKWGIAPELAVRLHELPARAGFDVSIFSGYRTPEHQASLPNGAPVDVSTHTSCPATGADVRPAIAITNVVKASLGRAGVEAGLRWGGGAPVDAAGIPVGVEWMHFDLGPRRR